MGELDEEMVYESRVGDIFALGATSWKIEDITHDRVLVSPAFGQPGKLPFWKGDSLGRPVDLGRALGAFMRELAASDVGPATERCKASGLDDYAANNLIQYLAEQRLATEVVPSDTTLVVERFHDELGDWRVVLHSPFGMPVHAPWALAVGQRLQQRYGMDGSAMAADDGIVLRVPMMEDEPPGAELFLFDPEEIEQIVTAEVGGSALFASRFRECAARALLLPRQNPGKRQPLWQQRQRSAQLLDVARKYPTFPIVLETVRECLQDVYDLPALKDIAASVERRELRIVETTTQQPSPFAKSLLFGYVAQFLYEGDSPLAERRAAALALDSTLLNELLGRVELRELLDAKVIDATERELQRLAPDRQVRGLEGVADLLRLLGPLTPDEVAARLEPARRPQPAPAAGAIGGCRRACRTEPAEAPAVLPAETPATEADAAAHLAALQRANRAIKVNIGGVERFAAVEDAARLRDALGVPLPMGVPLAFIEPVADPLGDLVSRYARTHGPFTAAEAAARLGLGVAVVGTALKRLAADGRVVEGEFRPHAAPPAVTSASTAAGGEESGVDDPARTVRRPPFQPAVLPVVLPPASVSEWCDAEVLRKLRRRSLAALRAEVEPVDATAYGRFLPAWQNVRHPGRPRAVRAPRPGRHRHGHRPALRRAHSGLGLGAARPGQPRLQLPAGHAGRTHGRRRSPLVRCRLAARQRRLGQPAPRRFGRTDAEPGHRFRTRRRPAAAPGAPAEQRRRLFLPAADRGCRRHGFRAERPGRGGRALGSRLGGPDHRRHVRPRQGPDRRRPHRAPAGGARPAGPRAAAQPARTGARHRPAGIARDSPAAGTAP